MAADFTIKQGDTDPIFSDTLTYSTGAPASLAGATVVFVMRSLTAADDITLTGVTTVVSTSLGTVQFAPSAADTANAGNYQANWKVTFPGGQVMTFPTVGYLSVTVEENITSAGGQQLVSLPDVKDYLGIAAGERDHDAALVRAIRSVRPVVENITGPIIVATHAETHDGGGPIIQIRRRPSSTYDTTPVLTLLTAKEYLGSTEHALTVVATSNLGSTYSCMIDEIGTITRLAGGGGITAFANSVKITYSAGQSSVPSNVYTGTLELLRVNWQTTRPRGTGRRTVADDQDGGVPLAFFVPRRVRELLAPNRRAPSIA